MYSLRLSSLFVIANIIIKITSFLLSLIVANHLDAKCNHRLQECIPPANEFGWEKCVGSCYKESLGLLTQFIFVKAA